MPALVVSDNATGRADLTTQAALGPTLVAIWETTQKAPHQFGALLEWMPRLPSKSWGGTHAGATISWRYRFIEALATVVSLVARTDAISGSADCPSIDGCQTESASKAKLLQARVGLALRF